MVKFKTFMLLTCLLGSGATAVLPAQNSKSATQRWSISEIYHNPHLKLRTVSDIENLLEGDIFYKIDEKGLHQCRQDAQGKNIQVEKTLVDFYKAQKEYSVLGDLFKNPNSFLFTKDKSKVLLFFNTEFIYRRSSMSDVVIWDLKNDRMHQFLSRKGKVQEVSFSPDETKVAYIRDNNLYYTELSTLEEVALTTDGQKNHILNGHTDWVYEEEFGFTKAYDWSGDSKSIAYLKFDESHVKEFSMMIWGDLYPQPYVYKYPKAGEANSKVSLHWYDLNRKTTATISLESPLQINTPDQIEYLPRIFFIPEKNTLLVYAMNRHQNHLTIWKVNNSKGEKSVLYEERNKYYIEITDNFYLFKDGKRFIISSEKEGFNQLHLYSVDGEYIKNLTPGKYDVEQLYGVDEEKGLIYFQASYSAPFNKEVLAVNIKHNKLQYVVPDFQLKGGVTHANFNKDFSTVILANSKANQPPVYCKYLLRKNNPQLLAVLEDNQILNDELADFPCTTKEFGIVPLRGATLEKSMKVSSAKVAGIDPENQNLLYYWMMKPQNMKKGKKYPVLMFLYGGPGSQQVLNQYAGTDYLWYQMLADKGYIVVCVDNRGTGGRGEAFKKCTYLQLGKLETEDQIAAARYFGQLDFVDETRIGIWGWSYGGFMSSSCLFKGNDVFKMAMAVAPVTNWKYYDNVYTERFMRTPAENPGGYENNSPINMVENLKGNYLLIHGSGDDNVHIQNSMDLISALHNADKQFTYHVYPNKNHSIYGGNTRKNLYDKLTDFILKNL